MAMDNKIITGVDFTIAAVGKQQQVVLGTILEGLKAQAELALVLANYYVPKDTHALEESGHIESGGRGLSAYARLMYGGPDAPYALYVHENLMSFHEPPTCAKWIERALKELKKAMETAMGRKIAESLTKWMNGVIVK